MIKPIRTIPIKQKMQHWQWWVVFLITVPAMLLIAPISLPRLLAEAAHHIAKGLRAIHFYIMDPIDIWIGSQLFVLRKWASKAWRDSECD